jgi:hypothetical protein
MTGAECSTPDNTTNYQPITVTPIHWPLHSPNYLRRRPRSQSGSA